MSDKTIPAGEFKARCLALLDDVERTGIPLVVTKRGKAVARIVPAKPRRARPLRGSVEFIGDIVAPTAERWEADE